MRSKKGPEALPYFDRLVKEFEQSDFLERAKKRIAELQAADTQPPSTEPKKPEPTKGF